MTTILFTVYCLINATISAFLLFGGLTSMSRERRMSKYDWMAITALSLYLAASLYLIVYPPSVNK